MTRSGGAEARLAGLYVVVAGEPLLAFEASDRLIARARAAGFTEREILTAETGFDWSRLLLAQQTGSLFGERRILELRLPSGKPGVEGARALEQLAAQLHPDTLVLVQLPALDAASRRSKWFTALSAAGQVIQTDAVTRERLPGWLQDRLVAQGQPVSQEGLMLLAARTEGNLLAAFQELQKLALLHPPGPISDAQLRAAVTDVARFSIEDLAAALLARDAERYARTARGLQEGGEALPLIVWSLAENVRGLLRASLALQRGRPAGQAVREARVWGERQGLIERHLQQFPVAALQRALQQIALLDRAAKGMAADHDPWQVLLQLGLDLMRAPRRSIMQG